MQKPKNAFGAFKRILSYMAEYKALLLLVVVSSYAVHLQM